MEADSQNTIQDDSLSLVTKKIIIPDTNVFLSDNKSLYKFADNDLVIHIKSIVEVDKYKKGNDSINYHAREFSRNIDKLSEDKIFNGGVVLGKNLGTLSIAINTPIHDDIKNNITEINIDAEIINLAYVTKLKNKERQVILVSKDTNMRLLAKSLGIIAQDYLNEKVENIDFLYNDVKTIELDEKIVAELYSNRTSKYKIIDSVVNQNYIIESKTKEKTLVKISDSGEIKLINNNYKVFNINPKNNEQIFAIDFILDKNISLITLEGRAGTGKTIISIAAALEQINSGAYKRLFYLRKTIEVGRAVGFLPGDLEAKLSPYMNGMQDNLEKLSENKDNKARISQYTSNKILVMEALAFIRGRSIEKSIIIIDEAQNLTPHEIKTIATRAGEGSKLIFMGDTSQIDDPYLDQFTNGFTYLIDKFKGQSCYAHVRLIKSERSALAELAGDLL